MGLVVIKGTNKVKQSMELLDTLVGLIFSLWFSLETLTSKN